MALNIPVSYDMKEEEYLAWKEDNSNKQTYTSLFKE
jgi:hypothetical protein